MKKSQFGFFPNFCYRTYALYAVNILSNSVKYNSISVIKIHKKGKCIASIVKLCIKTLNTATCVWQIDNTTERLPNVTNVPKNTLVPQFDFIQAS